MLPGIERQPRQKLEPSPERLLGLLQRWQDEAVRAGRTITRIALAFEAGRDGFWLARWLEARGVEAHVIHPSNASCWNAAGLRRRPRRRWPASASSKPGTTRRGGIPHSATARLWPTKMRWRSNQRERNQPSSPTLHENGAASMYGG